MIESNLRFFATEVTTELAAWVDAKKCLSEFGRHWGTPQEVCEAYLNPCLNHFRN